MSDPCQHRSLETQFLEGIARTTWCVDCGAAVRCFPFISVDDPTPEGLYRWRTEGVVTTIARMLGVTWMEP